MRNVLLTIEYDGSGFSGWQIQPHARTVQGELTRVLSAVCGEEIKLNGTSRTDAGVHAYGQAASFTGNFGIPAERIPIAANNLLTDIRITSAHDMPEGFHARFSTKGKTYLYRIAAYKAGEKDIFLRNYRYQLDGHSSSDLMEDAMREAASYLEGTHDFSSFKSAGGNPCANPVKTISGIVLRSFDSTSAYAGDVREYELRITGDSFLYNMVRIIVGTLVEIGLGTRTPQSIIETIEAKDRRSAGHTAPASGLWLERIYFDEYR